MVTFSLFFFFFQAEDGIRDLTVTGVQTCALPISGLAGGVWVRLASRSDDGRRVGDHGPLPGSPGGGHEAPTRARRPAAGWPAPGPPVPGWTPRAAPPVGRGAPAPGGGWRCRVRV